MKAEINNENKAKFFALYWGQSVLYEPFIGQCVYVNQHIPWGWENLDYLLLKPLSQISDEDAQYLLYKNAKDFKRNADKGFHKDELRVRGYATNWHGLTVQEMVNAGWIKLIEK